MGDYKPGIVERRAWLLRNGGRGGAAGVQGQAPGGTGSQDESPARVAGPEVERT